ncbi:MAG: 23S rRNA (adenine(2503)-C(2))-methyltransferase RlmN, partial [Clostridia bacterium]|nr:23S rRNA (adenine(2503)-C(2))-methyltransferase RlmN [Clostridia bacterium]
MLDIKSLEADELRSYISEVGEPDYRAKQIFKWLHKGITSFDEMTDISKQLRDKLKESAYIANAVIEK